MKKRKPNHRRLSVYLMKEEHQDFDSLVKEDVDKYEVKQGDSNIGTLYIKPIQGHCPTWFSLFDECVQKDLRKKLSNQNISAVFLLKQSGRVFAITFGYGRSLLKIGTWEERFGLRVVLNSIDRDKVRIIDRKNLDTMLTNTRTQTSRKCAIEEFNLDVQQILLKAVTGDPIDKNFASSISGADSLSIACQTTIETIKNKCEEMYSAFVSQEYRKVFPWVENITEVTDRQKISQLNDEMIRRIKDGITDQLFLAVPDIVEWTNIEGFKFREKGGRPHTDIYLLDFMETVDSTTEISCQYLRQRRVYNVYEETGVIEPKWSVFQCLNCEIADGTKNFILTEGKWYEVNSSFVVQVNDQIKDVNRCLIKLIAGKNEKEIDYCQRLYESDKSYYALMDRKSIRFGGGHSQIEFCDLFTKDRKLIHLKRYAGSSVLSHLFTQGTNGARAFLADVEFRRKVNEKLPSSHKFSEENQPTPKDYEIIFGIISETADDLPDKLPFFSKITLMRAMQELSGIMGFKISLAGIKVEA